jgi:PBP1b-binding outer membrane lipoprotein LpoB
MNKRLSMLFVAIFFFAGCGAAPVREVQSPRDALTELRTALAMMSEDDSSLPARLELERARSWMNETSAAIDKDDSPQSITLLLELSRGQLVLVKSIIERKKAEAALTNASKDYRENLDALKSIRENKETLDEASRGSQ